MYLLVAGFIFYYNLNRKYKFEKISYVFIYFFVKHQNTHKAKLLIFRISLDV